MAGYVLYGYPESGSGAVEAALTYADIPFKNIVLDPEDGFLQSDRFKAVNPRQQVPALVHPDGSVITEVPAILNHLADAFPATGLAPKPGSSARAQHDRWLAFLHANVYEAVLRLFYTERYTSDPDSIPSVQNAAKSYITRHLTLFGDAIAPGPYFGGSTPSNVDFLAWILVSWLEPDHVTAASPAVARLARALEAEPKLADVVARNTESP